MRMRMRRPLQKKSFGKSVGKQWGLGAPEMERKHDSLDYSFLPISAPRALRAVPTSPSVQRSAHATRPLHGV